MKKHSKSYKKISSDSTTNSLKIGIIGASGRLGSAILSAAEARGLDVEPLSARMMPGEIESKRWIYVGLRDSLQSWIQKALSDDVRLVIGTTGLTVADFEAIREAAQKIPIFYAPNFSLGITLMKKFVVELGKKFYADACIDLIETHHAAKKDSPSGTALWLAQNLKDQGRDCQIRSLREGDVVGIHTLQFNTAEEKITLSHESHNLSTFGRGALAACQFLENRSSGLYGMEDLLEMALLQDNGAQ